jgi:hypothetical protein
MDTKRPDENKYPTLQNIYPKIIPVKTTSPSPQPTRSPPEARSYNWSVHLKSVSDALKDYCRKASSRTPKYFRRSTNALSSVMQSNNSFSARNLQTTMPTFRKHANNHWRACRLHLPYFMLLHFIQLKHSTYLSAPGIGSRWRISCKASGNCWLATSALRNLF